jgi:hypothetical protein
MVVGAWRFVGARLTTENGEVNDTPPDYAGYLIYTADGHVAYLRMKAQLPAFAAGNLEQGTAEEKLAAYDNFVAYCGSYELREGNTLVHHVELSSFPNVVGTELVRTFALDGDELAVTTQTEAHTVPGRYRATLRFRRA